MESLPTRRIIIERVRTEDLGEFNTNNHPRDEDDAEALALDYQEEHRKTNLMNYAHLVDYPIAWTYKFTPDECRVLRECADKGRHLTSALLFKEELAPIIERLQGEWKADEIVQDTMWFFRFNSCSPKDGVGEYPVYAPSQVINMIATSKRGWGALCDGEDTLYFVPYVKGWDMRREFRVFIRKGRVTGISQYDPYNKCFLSGQSHNTIQITALNIVTWLECEILPKVLPAVGTNDVTADVYVGDGAQPRIVEFNTFGYWQAAGSALFHWLKDRKKLYGEDGKVWMRIIK